MALLIDNDVVDKLGRLDLLKEAKSLLKSKYGELVILDTLKYKLCPRKISKRKKCNALVMSRIEKFIEDVKEISPVVSDDLYDIMDNVKGLDIGEMQLFQALCSDEDSVFLTGDKRFLECLAGTKELGEMLKQVNGRFICFEQIICYLIDELSFEYIKNKFLSAMDENMKIDITLKICFEGQDQAIEDTVLKNFNYYIIDLREKSHNLLFNGV